MKKRILHVITGLGVGGTERWLVQLLPHLNTESDNRVCCLMGRGPMGPELEKHGVHVYYCDLTPLGFFGGVTRFNKIIKDFQPDTMVTYLIHADLFGRFFGRLFGVKRILASQRGSLLQWEFLRHVDRFTTSLVNGYIVQNDVAKQELMQKLGLPERKFTVIPNAIDMSLYDPKAFDRAEDRKKLGLAPQDKAIVCVGRLRRGKGHEFLLDAFELIHREHPNAQLLLVGDGEREEALKAQAARLESKEHIHFLGNRDDVKNILHASDIFALPTLGEGMSNAILEAMASSLPCVVTDIKENQVLIEQDKTGLLVPTENSAALASAFSELLQNAAKAKQLGEAAHQKITREYDILEISKRMQKLVADV